MPGQDRLKPQLRRHGIDRRSPCQQLPGRHGGGLQRDPVRRVLYAKIPRAQARRGFRMGLDDDAPVGMVGDRPGQHGGKGPLLHPPKPHGRIPPHLIDHQHIAGVRQGQRRVMQIVFRQVRGDQPGNSDLRPRHQGGVIQRMGGQQMLQIRRGGGVEMHAAPVDQQTQRRLSRSPRMDRAQKRILNPQQRGPSAVRHRLAAPRQRALAPHRHSVAGTGQPQ